MLRGPDWNKLYAKGQCLYFGVPFSDDQWNELNNAKSETKKNELIRKWREEYLKNRDVITGKLKEEVKAEKPAPAPVDEPAQEEATAPVDETAEATQEAPQEPQEEAQGEATAPVDETAEATQEAPQEPQEEAQGEATAEESIEDVKTNKAKKGK